MRDSLTKIGREKWKHFEVDEVKYSFCGKRDPILAYLGQYLDADEQKGIEEALLAHMRGW